MKQIVKSFGLKPSAGMFALPIFEIHLCLIIWKAKRKVSEFQTENDSERLQADSGSCFLQSNAWKVVASKILTLNFEVLANDQQLGLAEAPIDFFTVFFSLISER